ncbi:hypothetical protein HE1_00087 [Holospora elegans E1]|uniref:Uncharacterized protein n=1 Tax=Holospora elegans E1 TaxID=1427503 RepID=A0A023DWI4_9PROT|nr:hypothetical protein [Holospora elegans]GAJ45778.1 hypothetical protein HE1_00087 [Holospora elegans E1]
MQRQKAGAKKVKSWLEKRVGNSIAGLVDNTPIASMGFNGSCDTVLIPSFGISDQGTKAWSRCYYG